MVKVLRQGPLLAYLVGISAICFAGVFMAGACARNFASLLDPSWGLNKGTLSRVEARTVILARVASNSNAPPERLEARIEPELSAPALALALDQAEAYDQPSSSSKSRGPAVAGWVKRVPIRPAKDETTARIIERSLRADL
jgi:hypothetical protein